MAAFCFHADGLAPDHASDKFCSSPHNSGQACVPFICSSTFRTSGFFVCTFETTFVVGPASGSTYHKPPRFSPAISPRAICPLIVRGSGREPSANVIRYLLNFINAISCTSQTTWIMSTSFSSRMFLAVVHICSLRQCHPYLP